MLYTRIVSAVLGRANSVSGFIQKTVYGAHTCTPWAMQIPFNIKDTVIQRVEVSYNQKNEINS
jgi:hypothetical protein